MKGRLANEIQPVNHFNIYESNSYFCNVGSGHDVRLTHTLTRPLSQSVIMMTANGHIHKFIKDTEQISPCRILIKIRALYFTIIPRNKFHFFSLE